MPRIHRVGDLRSSACLARTEGVAPSRPVFVEGKLIATEGMINSHGGGALIASSGRRNIRVGGALIITTTDTAGKDGAKHTPAATKPGTIPGVGCAVRTWAYGGAAGGGSTK